MTTAGVEAQFPGGGGELPCWHSVAGGVVAYHMVIWHIPFFLFQPAAYYRISSGRRVDYLNLGYWGGWRMTDKPFPIVAIGASAGGVEALSALFSALPPQQRRVSNVRRGAPASIERAAKGADAPA